MMFIVMVVKRSYRFLVVEGGILLWKKIFEIDDDDSFCEYREDGTDNIEYLKKQAIAEGHDIFVSFGNTLKYGDELKRIVNCKNLWLKFKYKNSKKHIIDPPAEDLKKEIRRTRRLMRDYRISKSELDFKDSLIDKQKIEIENLKNEIEILKKVKFRRVKILK